MTPRELRLLAALERLAAAARVTEPILRGGLCPKCAAGSGGVDPTEFALAMCSNEDWSDMHDALVFAESEIADANLDAVRPGRERLRDVENSMVALDFSYSQGLVR